MLLFSKRESGSSPYKATMAGIYARSPLGTGNSGSWIDGELIFATAGAASQGIKQRMVIDKEGSVGIGTTTPSEALDVTGNIKASGSITGATLAGTLSTAAQPNITSVGTLTSLTVSGQIESTSGAVLSSHGNFNIVTGTCQTAAQPNITSVGTLTGLSVSGGVVSNALFKLDVPDNGGAPATTAIIDINGYEGRGAGIKIQDSKNSAAGASNREWFIGSGYSQSGFNIGYASDGNQSSYAAQNKLTIDTSGNVGIGTATPSEALDVNGNILSNGVIRAFNSTAETAQLEVGRNSNEFIEMRVSDPDCFITANQDSDSNAAHHFVLDRAFGGTGSNDFEIRKGGTTQVTVDTDSNVSIVGTVNAKGFSLNANTFTVVSTTSTLAASTNGLTVILQNTGPITITLPTLAAGHVTTFIAETNHDVTFVADTGITINSFQGANTTAGIFAQCQVIYKTTTAAFLGGNLV